jgi:D-alanyl-D-alanine carboxypeptidase
LTDFQDAFERLNATIEQKIPSLNFPGLAIGITDRERLLFLGNYGSANRETQQPVTSETLFQIGSISKSFSSIAVLQLQEQGVLKIDDPVKNYLPWFKVQSKYDPITLRHLLSHTAGIIMGADQTPAAITEAWALRDTFATAPPGEMFHYSNSGYKVLGLVLQAVLGDGLADILRQRILNPLDMSATEPVITNASRARLAVGYQAFYDDRPLPRGGKLAPATWFESDTADGSISSNTEDMCRYLRALLNRSENLLSPESFEQIIQPHIPTSDDLHGEHYGLGLSTRQIDGHQVIGHSGGMVGYTADMLADLDAGLGVVVLTNGPGDPEKISQYILSLIRSAQNKQDLPEFSPADPYQVENVEDYSGRYQCGNKEFTLNPKGEQLYLEFEGDSVHLEPGGPDVFLVPHPSFELFSLRFIRGANSEGEDKHPISEALHGPDWYVHPRYQGQTSFEIPPEWQVYTGHYRSHNPWLTNFRVVIQRDSLVLIHQWDTEEPLHQTGPGCFRIGTEPRSPEFIQFDMTINGKAMQANLSGGVYCRTFTD